MIDRTTNGSPTPARGCNRWTVHRRHAYSSCPALSQKMEPETVEHLHSAFAQMVGTVRSSARRASRRLRQEERFAQPMCRRLRLLSAAALNRTRLVRAIEHDEKRLDVQTIDFLHPRNPLKVFRPAVFSARRCFAFQRQSMISRAGAMLDVRT